jgi:hypothetical protein
MRKRILEYVLCFLLMAVLGLARCEAQFLGYTAAQSVAVSAFTNQAANGTSAILTNIGQSAHFLSYCNTNFAGTIALEASPDGTFAAPNTLATATYGQQTTTDSSCHVLQAGGYYPTVRARVLNYVGGSTTAFYTAIASPVTFAPAAFASVGPTSPIVCDRSNVVSLTASNSTAIVTVLAGANIYICSMTFSFNAATTTGNLSVQEYTTNACSVAASNGGTWFAFITSGTPQLFTVGGDLGSRLRTIVPGHAFCLFTGAITATTELAYSYAQF